MNLRALAIKGFMVKVSLAIYKCSRNLLSPDTHDEVSNSVVQLKALMMTGSKAPGGGLGG